MHGEVRHRLSFALTMPPSIELDAESSLRPSIEIEEQSLLELGLLKRESRRRSLASHIGTLYNVNGFQIFMVILFSRELWKGPLDPSHQAPTNDITEYMGFPTDETDQLWLDLYNFGISNITEDEAKKLHTPTIPIFGTKKYLIQLDTLYPECHTEDSLDSLKFPNRTIHPLMCHTDVSPVPFHVNVPARKGIFPRLATTHTCRNLTKIQEWARERFAGDGRMELGPEEAMDEDIQFLYELFPEDTFFKYWRQHPYNGGDGS
ncbi:hypothetical protein BDV40DRAFT_283901 [Aspergillus tamarii]|uniref:Uncharacterized protein n=1 Tax=Aspergillus tamarii TaxID=41984 RepID=A0A5N6VBW1_ASPTM|nr:hypothetical protein BDV40DRAFT_283901 [Aspergillus tamarii]